MRIIPIKELKNTSEISEMCHEKDEPIFITKNGYGDLVIMSMEHYERTMQYNQMLHELEISEQNIKDGEYEDAFEALAKIKKDSGL